MNGSFRFAGDLFPELARLQQHLDEMFQSGLPTNIRALARGGFPAVNVGTSPETVEILAFVPGVDPKALQITVDKGLLVISGERATGEHRAVATARTRARARAARSSTRRSASPARSAASSACPTTPTRRRSTPACVTASCTSRWPSASRPGRARSPSTESTRSRKGVCDEREHESRCQDRPGPCGAAVGTVPAVDIVENDDGITLLADMPGVPKDRLAIKVDGDNLTIEGSARSTCRRSWSCCTARSATRTYRRSFTLSRELDPSKIEATLKDGVLRHAHSQVRGGAPAPHRGQRRLTADPAHRAGSFLHIVARRQRPITSPKRTHALPSKRTSCIASIGAKSVGLVLIRMPGSAIGVEKSFRLAACFITFSRVRLSPHCLSTCTSVCATE